MEMKLRKLWPLIGALCVTAFAPSFAHSNYGSSSNGSGSSYGSSMDSSSGQSGQQGTYQRGTFREITPNAGPRVAHGADVFITANFIWWKATQDGLSYASNGFAGTPTGADIFAGASSGKTKSVGEDWAPGFKVGLGLNLGHDGWDIFAQYTWLHNSNSNSVSVSTAVPIAQTGRVRSSYELERSGDFNRATANWDLHFNVIDLELGRNFYLSQFLTMRPHIGFKGTWQDQDMTFKYHGDNFQLPDSLGANQSVTGPYRAKGSTDTWGIGVRGGLNLAYYMAKSWSIYGNFAWTTMWTNYHKLDRKDTLFDTITGNNSTRVNISNDSLYTVKYIGEMELGLRWEIWFYDDNYHFAIQAGWEEQVWVNWGQFPVFSEQQTEHDLALHGLNLKFRFDF